MLRQAIDYSERAPSVRPIIGQIRQRLSLLVEFQQTLSSLARYGRKKARRKVNCTPKVGHQSNDLGCFFMSKHSARFKQAVVKD
ncbi:hypothetical protein QCE62_02770, partial [Caballeronia sp. LZ033]|uniref:hypothetical protein n=1 Tax=Caballeronia sp. LZ033 TaxID=3038566 RepID=UPI0028547C21